MSTYSKFTFCLWWNRLFSCPCQAAAEVYNLVTVCIFLAWTDFLLTCCRVYLFIHFYEPYKNMFFFSPPLLHQHNSSIVSFHVFHCMLFYVYCLLFLCVCSHTQGTHTHIFFFFGVLLCNKNEGTKMNWFEESCDEVEV